MVHTQDDSYVQPEVTVTTSSSGEGSTYTIAATKPKRKRKDWVYKDQYDKLQTRFKNTVALAYLGWGALILYVLFDSVT